MKGYCKRKTIACLCTVRVVTHTLLLLLLHRYCMAVVAIFALGIMLIELRSVLLPLCFAVFLSLLYIPVVDFLTCR